MEKINIKYKQKKQIPNEEQKLIKEIQKRIIIMLSTE